MSGKVYKRKPGDFEIRILPDGRVVVLAPDEAMMDVARAVDPQNGQVGPQTEKVRNGRTASTNGTGD